MRKLSELVRDNGETLKMIQEWVAEENNKNGAVILPRDNARGEEELLRLQVTTKSVLGAIAYYTGGMTFQNGWLRVLGSGSTELPRTLSAWNSGKLEGALLFADDALGGFFALDGGYFGNADGAVYYFASDTLEWEPMEMGHSDFIYWACTGDMDTFYRDLRWSGWEAETKALGGDRALSIMPFLWAKGPELGERSRKSVPVEEAWGFQRWMAEQLTEK